MDGLSLLYLNIFAPPKGHKQDNQKLATVSYTWGSWTLRPEGTEPLDLRELNP